jgi:hypothetical protein
MPIVGAPLDIIPSINLFCHVEHVVHDEEIDLLYSDTLIESLLLEDNLMHAKESSDECGLGILVYVPVVVG